MRDTSSGERHLIAHHNLMGSADASLMAVRYRPGVTRTTARTVHLVAPPFRSRATVTALCGAVLAAENAEIVEPRQGMPCVLCLLSHIHAAAPASDPPGPDPPEQTHPADYRALGWPVITQEDQVLLTLDDAVTALILPATLADPVEVKLVADGCPPAVLIHPCVPEHRTLLAGERFGVPLPWPSSVHEAIGVLPLPPSTTSRGPIRWWRLPVHHALPDCREIDVFTAVRATLSQR